MARRLVLLLLVVALSLFPSGSVMSEGKVAPYRQIRVTAVHEGEAATVEVLSLERQASTSLQPQAFTVPFTFDVPQDSVVQVLRVTSGQVRIETFLPGHKEADITAQSVSGTLLIVRGLEKPLQGVFTGF